jgi:hypothetical protein
MPDYPIVALISSINPGTHVDNDWEIYDYHDNIIASRAAPNGVTIDPADVGLGLLSPAFFTIAFPQPVASFVPQGGDGSFIYIPGYNPEFIGFDGFPFQPDASLYGGNYLLGNHPIMTGYFKFVYYNQDVLGMLYAWVGYSTPPNWNGLGDFAINYPPTRLTQFGILGLPGRRYVKASHDHNDDFYWLTYDYAPEHIILSTGASLVSATIDWGDGSPPEDVTPGVIRPDERDFLDYFRPDPTTTVYARGPLLHHAYQRAPGHAIITTTFTDSWGRTTIYKETVPTTTNYYPKYLETAPSRQGTVYAYVRTVTEGGVNLIQGSGDIITRNTIAGVDRNLDAFTPAVPGGAGIWQADDGTIVIAAFVGREDSPDNARTAGRSAGFWSVMAGVGAPIYAHYARMHGGAIATCAVFGSFTTNFPPTYERPSAASLWFAALTQFTDGGPVDKIADLDTTIWDTQSNYFYVREQPDGTLIVTDWRTLEFTSTDRGRTWTLGAIDIWSDPAYRYTHGVQITGGGRATCAVRVDGDIPDALYSLWFTRATDGLNYDPPIKIDGLAHEEPYALTCLRNSSLLLTNGQGTTTFNAYLSTDGGRNWGVY